MLDMTNTNHHSQPEATMTINQTPQPIPAGWSISAYVLLVERRLCETCGEVHEAPAKNLRVELIRQSDGATRTISLPDLHKFYSLLPKQLRAEFEEPTLPRRIHYLDTEVVTCQSCFEEVASSQPDFFQRKSLLTPEDVRFAANYAADYAEVLSRLPSMAEVEKALHEKAAKKRKVAKKKEPGTLDLVSFAAGQRERLEQRKDILAKATTTLEQNK